MGVSRRTAFTPFDAERLSDPTIVGQQSADVSQVVDPPFWSTELGNTDRSPERRADPSSQRPGEK